MHMRVNAGRDARAATELGLARRHAEAVRSAQALRTRTFGEIAVLLPKRSVTVVAASSWTAVRRRTPQPTPRGRRDLEGRRERGERESRAGMQANGGLSQTCTGTRPREVAA